MSNHDKQGRIAKILAKVRQQPRKISTNISNELGIIGEKVIVDWLISSNYPFIHFGYHGWAGSAYSTTHDWEETGFLTPEEKERVLSLFNDLRRIRYGRPD